MRRPDAFTLDYSHPLAQGLAFALLGNRSERRVEDSSFDLLHATYSSGGLVFNDTLQRTGVTRFASGITPTTSGFAANTPTKIRIADGNVWTNAAWMDLTGWGDGAFLGTIGVTNNSAFLNMRGNGTVGVYLDGYQRPNVSAGGGYAALHHWAVTRNGSLFTFFRNGVQIDTASDSNTFYGANWADIRKICGSIAGSTNFNHKIYDPIIHNRILSPSEIALLADRTDPMLGGLIVEERPVLYFDMGGSTEDALTASDLVTGSPVLGTPTLGQTHALTASDLTTSAPVLGAPALTQAHALTAAGLTTSGPSLGAPAIGQAHALTASSLIISSPVLGTPSLTENAPTVDNLTADNLVVGSPVLGTPALGQAHTLAATSLTTSAPVLGTPALGQAHALAASGVTVEGPVLGAPALAQIHALTAQNFTASSPVLGAPAVGQIHALTASSLAVSSPVMGTPALAENAADVDALAANDLVVGSPALGSPALGQIHVLGSDGLVTGSPVLGSPTITQVHALAALGLAVGVPVLGTPELNKTALGLDVTANLSSVGLDVMYLDSIGVFTAQLTSSGCKSVTLKSVGNFEVAEREE